MDKSDKALIEREEILNLLEKGKNRLRRAVLTYPVVTFEDPENESYILLRKMFLELETAEVNIKKLYCRIP